MSQTSDLSGESSKSKNYFSPQLTFHPSLLKASLFKDIKNFFSSLIPPISLQDSIKGPPQGCHHYSRNSQLMYSISLCLRHYLLFPQWPFSSFTYIWLYSRNHLRLKHHGIAEYILDKQFKLQQCWEKDKLASLWLHFPYL